MLATRVSDYTSNLEYYRGMIEEHRCYYDIRRSKIGSEQNSLLLKLAIGRVLFSNSLNRSFTNFMAMYFNVYDYAQYTFQ